MSSRAQRGDLFYHYVCIDEIASHAQGVIAKTDLLSNFRFTEIFVPFYKDEDLVS
jgi:hypothetical protein